MSSSYPLRYDSALESIVDSLADSSQEATFRAIYEWVSGAVAYDKELYKKMQMYPHPERLRYGICLKDGLQVFRSKKGICTEQALLVMTMARIAGIKAFYVEVDKDANGHDVKHACCGAKINGKLILADTVYKMYNVKHQHYTPVTGNEFVRRFKVTNGIDPSKLTERYDYDLQFVGKGLEVNKMCKSNNKQEYTGLERELQKEIIPKQNSGQQAENTSENEDTFDISLLVLETIAQLGSQLKSMLVPITVAAILGLPPASYGISCLMQKIKSRDSARIEYILRK